MKHAFLIMAFNNWNQLKSLIKSLDDKRNTIYVHIDKKSKDFNMVQFINSGLSDMSNLKFIERKPLYWGTLSEIECELDLISAALMDGFDYCHLLSGQDLPLKSMEEIDVFFTNNAGRNFIEFNDSWYDLTGKQEQMSSGSYKINYYHPLVRCKNYRQNKLIKYTDHFIAHLQKWMGLKRHNWDIYAGSQFFSISYDFAQYVASHTNEIKKEYRCTLASSEVFLQTMIMMSPFKETIYSMDTSKGNLRYIDWSKREGSGPRTFRMEDYDTIISLPEDKLFGRKFNEIVDNLIIEKLLKHIAKKKET